MDWRRPSADIAKLDFFPTQIASRHAKSPGARISAQEANTKFSLSVDSLTSLACHQCCMIGIVAATFSSTRISIPKRFKCDQSSSTLSDRAESIEKLLYISAFLIATRVRLDQAEMATVMEQAAPFDK
ncbi:hypothetical protein [Mesorhizobium sp. M0578]|uniref:hypothetical protein n=1 Tax=unclassified Mesorhizobium TaxID=325217 RepID=UPI0033397124